MLTQEQRLRIEARTCKQLLEGAVADLQERGGDVRAFSVCLLRAAYELSAEVFGTGDQSAKLLARWYLEETVAEAEATEALSNAKPAGSA